MNTFGCMGGTEILIVLFFISGGGFLLFFASLLPYNYAVKRLAQSPTPHGPGTLFAAALGIAVFWASSIAITLWLLFEDSGFEKLAHSPDDNGARIAFCAFIGSVMFLFLLLLRKQGKDSPEAALPAGQRPIRPFQVWAQDLFIALVCYGFGLAILSAFTMPSRDPLLSALNASRREDFLLGAVYIFIAGTLGLLFAADLCRRTEPGQSPGKRAAIFAGVFTFFPPLLPLALLAWWRWRRALTMQKKLAPATS